MANLVPPVSGQPRTTATAESTLLIALTDLYNELKGSETAAGLATLQAILDGTYAPVEDAALTGTPTAPTAAPGTDTTQVATTAFVTDAVDNATHAPRTALWLPGASGNYVSCPDSAALSILGDLDLRMKIALADYTPPAISSIAAKQWADFSWRLYLASSGVLTFSWTTADGSTISKNCTVNLSTVVANGADLTLRVTLDVDNGAAGNDVKFWTSDDYDPTVPAGGTWNPLGTTVTTPTATSIKDTTDPINFGSEQNGVNPCIGRFYWLQILNGIAGTLVADYRSDVSPGNRYRDSLGNIWTTNGSAWSVEAA